MRTAFIKISWATLLAMIFLIESATAGISLSGTSGLIRIPTAQIIESRKTTIGLNYVNRKYAYLGCPHYDNYVAYVTVGYLPRLEISARVTFVPGMPGNDGTQTYKDGMVSLQCLILKEGRYGPAIAVGARDIYSFMLLNTSFIVLSKNVKMSSEKSLGFHLGYGSDLMRQHIGVPRSDQAYPVGHTLMGFFGGIDINFNKYIITMIEYDTKKINLGIRLNLLFFLTIDVALFNRTIVGGGMNLSFFL